VAKLARRTRAGWRSLTSLRARILLAVGLLALIAVASTGALLFGISAATRDIERAAAAHRRIELLGNLSSRVGDYALLALQAAGPRQAAPARLDGPRDRVSEAFGFLDKAMRAAVDDAPDATTKTRVAARSITLARMQARFAELDRQVTSIAAGGADNGALRTTLDMFATAFAPLLSTMIEEERVSSVVAQDETLALRNRLAVLGALAVAAVVALALFVYLGVARPLLDRISAVATAAAAVGGGEFETRLAVRGRDELSLLMANFNRMAARLGRRERAVRADRARLTETIEANTADLRAANRRLEEIDAARRRFFADVSHELRTPLTVILGEADVTLRAATNDEPTYRNALATIRTRARRLRRRVEDLLRVARSATGQIELEFAPVEIGAVVAEAAEDVSGLARTARVAIDLTGMEPLPPVLADADWVRQVASGLLDNAIRHAPPGSRVSLATRAAEDAVAIVVTDEGAGIPADALPHVFERFYRGRDSDTLGYGIGLALAKWVVEQHHGTIEIRSPAEAADESRGGGPGTTVVVRLPLAAVAGEGEDLAGERS
jgi:two-component system OmpR family sensor kinase